MIDPDYLADLRRRATADAEQLTVAERHELATLALGLGNAARATVRGEYLQQALDLLGEAAPTLALELRRVLAAAALYQPARRDIA